ncbi:TetR/AcrR family transcriptional regulator [Micromonospora vinacea]|uniref:AcrR family transcriptional regulator n=1 Tax=Micromonospora vinacea TaxID=709878 RepID=A0ABS0K5X7_9ACTN|nr:TetR-like C-terminal domain-containing protein [Micromonospora vinacea]MBG6103876.1 AcrR family transcriptional regulator [Micromonospora vinacea]WSZ79842.1 WHG domain-containing protein [Micromonospora sp. NBC_00860]WTA70068.1 WHG domain-containing protein [Micromonospora sp. NBC_00855]
MTPARRTTPARGRGAPSATAEVREALMTVGCRLLSSDGPAALSARRLAAEVGTSTMAIYTHFGGVPDLVEAIVQMGLDRLAERLAAVRPTDDPVTDLARLARAYRDSALADPHLYAVMLGGVAQAHFGLKPRDLELDSLTLGAADVHVRRSIEAGRFRAGPHWDLTVQVWAMMHGWVMLEIAGYGIGASVDDYLLHVLVGAGDSLADATRSVRRSGGVGLTAGPS